MSEILSGKVISEQMAGELAKKIIGLKISPKLVIVQVGNNEASNKYIEYKKKFAEKIGVQIVHKKYDEKVDEKTLISDIKKYNTDTSVHGIIVQLPISKNLNKSKVIESIDPKKDVDGLTSSSIKKLFDNEPGFVSATTKGILKILDHKKINLAGKKVVVVGRSSLVGKPTALALMNRNATVTICHSQTKNLEEETKRADILIVAIGKPKMITKKFVSLGQIVIDVGITVELDESKKKVVGDVDFENVKNIVQAISLVPGGVGPLTVACLFENVVLACL